MPADIRLSRVADLASASPREALDSLDAIDYEGLSDADKQYYDFLLIKSRDKAFIHHTSDSLILKVIDNEEKHRGRGRYPEALYYGGRVYHDMGDYPTALNYYHNTMDIIAEDETQIPLKGCVLSQIGGLLNSLRLYEQAIPYVEEVIKLDSIMRDSVNLMYAMELLGSINIHAGKYDSAEKLFNRAKSLASISSSADTVRHNMYMAAIKYNQGQIDSALNLIRPAVPDIDSISRNTALAYACDIYLEAGIQDTAFLYARELIRSKNPHNRRTGYHVILSNGLIEYVPSDSIVRFAHDYSAITESYLNQNGNRAALIQNSFYNYQLHQRERERTEADNKKLKNWIVSIMILALSLSICLLYQKGRNKTQLLQLHEAIDIANLLRQTLEKSMEKQDNLSDDGQENHPDSGLSIDNTSPDIEGLRIRLKKELLTLCHVGGRSYSVPPEILKSEAYKKVLEYIKEKHIIPEKDALWKELEEVVLRRCPELKYRLHILTGGKIKDSDFHLALLIKCGISSTDISILAGRAKSTIAYRKHTLGLRVFDEKMENWMIDHIIRLL